MKPFAILLEIPQLSVVTLGPVLFAQQEVNTLWMRSAHSLSLPPLYSLFPRIFYYEDPHHDRLCPADALPVDSQCPTERFSCIPAVWKRGYGDCKDLATWRAAELNVMGDTLARAIAVLSDSRDNLIHILVRRGDGGTEDPSARMGMAAYFAAKNNRAEKDYFRRMRRMAA